MVDIKIETIPKQVETVSAGEVQSDVGKPLPKALDAYVGLLRDRLKSGDERQRDLFVLKESEKWDGAFSVAAERGGAYLTINENLTNIDTGESLSTEVKKEDEIKARLSDKPEDNITDATGAEVDGSKLRHDLFTVLQYIESETRVHQSEANKVDIYPEGWLMRDINDLIEVASQAGNAKKRDDLIREFVNSKVVGGGLVDVKYIWGRQEPVAATVDLLVGIASGDLELVDRGIDAFDRWKALELEREGKDSVVKNEPFANDDIRFNELALLNIRSDLFENTDQGVVAKDVVALGDFILRQQELASSATSDESRRNHHLNAETAKMVLERTKGDKGENPFADYEAELQEAMNGGLSPSELNDVEELDAGLQRADGKLKVVDEVAFKRYLSESASLMLTTATGKRHLLALQEVWNSQSASVAGEVKTQQIGEKKGQGEEKDAPLLDEKKVSIILEAIKRQGIDQWGVDKDGKIVDKVIFHQAFNYWTVEVNKKGGKPEAKFFVAALQKVWEADNAARVVEAPVVNGEIPAAQPETPVNLERPYDAKEHQVNLRVRGVVLGYLLQQAEVQGDDTLKQKLQVELAEFNSMNKYLHDTGQWTVPPTDEQVKDLAARQLTELSTLTPNERHEKATELSNELSEQYEASLAEESEKLKSNVIDIEGVVALRIKVADVMGPDRYRAIVGEAILACASKSAAEVEEMVTQKVNEEIALNLRARAGALTPGEMLDEKKMTYVISKDILQQVQVDKLVQEGRTINTYTTPEQVVASISELTELTLRGGSDDEFMNSVVIRESLIRWWKGANDADKSIVLDQLTTKVIDSQKRSDLDQIGNVWGKDENVIRERLFDARRWRYEISQRMQSIEDNLWISASNNVVGEIQQSTEQARRQQVASTVAESNQSASGDSVTDKDIESKTSSWLRNPAVYMIAGTTMYGGARIAWGLRVSPAIKGMKDAFAENGLR